MVLYLPSLWAPPPHVVTPQSVRCLSCFCLGTGFYDWLSCSGLFFEDFLSVRLALQAAALVCFSVKSLLLFFLL